MILQFSEMSTLSATLYFADDDGADVTYKNKNRTEINHCYRPLISMSYMVLRGPLIKSALDTTRLDISMLTSHGKPPPSPILVDNDLPLFSNVSFGAVLG